MFALVGSRSCSRIFMCLHCERPLRVMRLLNKYSSNRYDFRASNGNARRHRAMILIVHDNAIKFTYIYIYLNLTHLYLSGVVSEDRYLLEIMHLHYSRVITYLRHIYVVRHLKKQNSISRSSPPLSISRHIKHL